MLAKIHVTHMVTGAGGLSDLCEGILKSGTRGLIYIDEPTTKATVVLDDMEATFKAVTKTICPSTDITSHLVVVEPGHCGRVQRSENPFPLQFLSPVSEVILVETGKLEHEYPPALKVKYKGS